MNACSPCGTGALFGRDDLSLAQMGEGLDVPFISLYGGLHLACHDPRRLVLDERANVRENGFTVGRVLDYAILGKQVLSDLKLRLNESDDLAIGRDDVDKRGGGPASGR